MATTTRRWHAPELGGRALLVVPVVLVLAGGWVKRWTDEDAYINLRVVDQILAGNGAVFNAGQRVEAFTSPLWLGLLVLLKVTLGALIDIEWAMVVVTLALTGAAFALGARTVRRLHGDDVVVLPVGLLVVAGVPVVWEFATSGLETALVWCWIAWCASVLLATADAEDAPAGRSRVGALVLLGLGPLLRPDLAVMSGCFLVAWLVLVRPSWRRVPLDLLVAGALALAYQLFRMGYYATLVPSTALAKDAGGVHLGQGIDYALDLSRTYWLWLPLLVVAGLLVATALGSSDRRRVALGGLVAAAAVHAAYMVVIGGDYMHGRLLLPALFAFALPAGLAWSPSASARRTAATAGAALVAVAWTIVVAGWIRYVNPDGFVPAISDRRDAVPLPHVRPVERDLAFLTGAEVQEAYQRGERGTVRVLGDHVDATGDPDRLVMVLGSIGLAGYNAGIDVHVVDIGGLAEPLAARSDPIDGRPAGHRKGIDLIWYSARYGVVPAVDDPARLEAARRALACAPLADLLADIEEPLTPGRFLSNLVDSVDNTDLRVAADPLEAEAELCGDG